MARTVLIAKNTFVWLDQLSRAYGRAITRLDQIPDEALATLARRGFDALWLIGLWERSRASQRIKRLCGNPEAVASAYSLHDYTIAADLGGAAAYEDLRDRARAHGIRLASDMVPNHMGIDSRWLIDHPERFLSLPASPFPAYRFDGPNLSDDHRVEIKIEDHYYDRSDAAVVFRRLDRWTGDVRFIYHGNDGTSFPWNDTAQLDFTRADIREAVIQTILRVARDFPIIRFDAAMTMAKRHFQRLWFPEPGSVGGYVNFMNNPDERTAVDQFGKGDKYFGVCTLMATMPGLPMFGHGQVEGFGERYGMEYRRAYYDEAPDAGLIARHERQIAPL